MVDPETVLEKLRHIRAALKRIADKDPKKRDDLFGNPDTQDIVLRNMQIALQGCLDIASHIVADEGWGSPTKSTEFFALLADQKVVSSALARSMSRLIKFRNILVHEYTKLDLEKTWQAISSGTGQIEAFCRAIAEWMEGA